MITREANVHSDPRRAGDRRGFHKAFTSAMTALLLLASYLGQVRGSLTEDAAEI